MAASDYFNKYLDVEASAHYPTVFVENIKINKSKVYQADEILVVGISHSGTSRSTVSAIEFAKSQQYITLAYTENNDSRLAAICDLAIRTQCEKELVPPETQGYTAAVLGIYLWAITIAKEKHFITDYDQKITGISEMIQTQLPQVIERSKAWIAKYQFDFCKMEKFNIMGSGLNYTAALESALKVWETTRKIGFALETEEFSHVIDLAYDDRNTVFIITDKKANHQRISDIIAISKKITKQVFLISDYDIPEEKVLLLPEHVDCDFGPIVNVVPFQLLGAVIAESLGIDTSKYPYDDIEGIAHI